MNEWRDRLLAGKLADEPLLRAKGVKAEASRSPDGRNLAAVDVTREAARTSNHRDDDRHRLAQESALLIREGREQLVSLVNLSGGGAMLEGVEGLRLWDRIELQFGDCGRLEAIIRWIRGGRIGVEFAHETRIHAGSATWADTLRAVIRRSFPDIALEMAAEDQADSAPADAQADGGRGGEQVARELRHPLIWSGLVHYNHDSTPVRLRNISGGGALIEGSGIFPLGAELLLDLRDAGALFGTVHWARGDQAGIAFQAPFDIKALAKLRPQVAGARWTAPDYLRDDGSSSSPWDAQWGRSDLGRLHRELEAGRPSAKRR